MVYSCTIQLVEFVLKERHLISINIPILIVCLALFSACNQKEYDNLPGYSKTSSLPSLTVKDFTTQYCDSGLLNMQLSAPIMETYTDDKPSYSIFKEGLTVTFYSGREVPSTVVSSKYAYLDNDNNIWELRDSVVIATDNGTRLETEQLFWDQSNGKDKIYTDRFVKITSEDQIIMGNGFESDSKLTKRRIKKVTATLYVDMSEQNMGEETNTTTIRETTY